MASRDELLRLAERVEKASGADPALDCEIGVAVEHEPAPFWPRYTSSIDAAMTLAGDEVYTQGKNLADDHPFSVLTDAVMDCPLEDFTKALPRYVTAACLRALAEKEPE